MSDSFFNVFSDCCLSDLFDAASDEVVKSLALKHSCLEKCQVCQLIYCFVVCGKLGIDGLLGLSVLFDTVLLFRKFFLVCLGNLLVL